MMSLFKRSQITNKRFQPLGFILVGMIILLSGHGWCIETESRLDFTLPAPESAAHKTYLGLPETPAFSLGQIQADIVIIEIFSMYCPICQKEAPEVNALFDVIQNRPSSDKTVKLIGIGAGNSPYEVQFFKEKYAIEFPLFSDPDFSIHQKVGEVGTPHFFGLALQKDGSFTVFYAKSGEISDPATFLETILNASGQP